MSEQEEGFLWPHVRDGDARQTHSTVVVILVSKQHHDVAHLRLDHAKHVQLVGVLSTGMAGI